MTTVAEAHSTTSDYDSHKNYSIMDSRNSNNSQIQYGSFINGTFCEVSDNDDNFPSQSYQATIENRDLGFYNTVSIAEPQDFEQPIDLSQQQYFTESPEYLDFCNTVPFNPENNNLYETVQQSESNEFIDINKFSELFQYNVSTSTPNVVETQPISPPTAFFPSVPIDADDIEAEEIETSATDTYEEYWPSKLKIGQKHPDPVVETAALASVAPTNITYTLALPAETIETGLLSALQLESITYASQAHEKYLPNKSRAGFLIGDGAGVGKGRTVAGLIFENFQRGRKKAIWISISADLLVDARRDLNDIGAGHIRVYNLSKLKYTAIDSEPNNSINEGVIFSTYASLISKQSGDVKNTRLQQLVEWCGTDFDGCIIFDECHKAKNLVPSTGKPTQTSLAVMKLQERLPNARIVYASATGATEPRNMGYMVRLGLWGDNTEFHTFNDFLKIIEKRGVGAMELVAMDMKLRGMYIARQLSFRGASFAVSEVPMDAEYVQMYDDCVALWLEVHETFKKAVQLLNLSSTNVIWGQYWATHQRFFKYLCMASKVNYVTEVAQAAIADGKCVVIGLQSTGDSRTREEIQGNDELRNFISTPKVIMRSLVLNHFPSQDPMPVSRKRKQPSPGSSKRSKSDSGEIIESFSDAVNIVNQLKHDLLAKIEAIGDRLPTNTLDCMMDLLGGPSKVAELTGRKGRVVRTQSNTFAYESRAEVDVSLERVNLQEKQRFMDGDKLVAIISEAASSGISLQSDRRVKNQRRRVHITLELPWSADRAIQQFGRTHRANQTSAPEYIFMISNLAGERRFAATIAKRLESLGALTHGDRRATDAGDFSQFNFDNFYGRKALRSIYATYGDRPQLMTDTGIPMRDICTAMANVGLIGHDVKENDKSDISRFFNRILGLPVNIQNFVFKDFIKAMEAFIENDKKKGFYDMGIKNIGNTQNVTLEKTLTFHSKHATGIAPIHLHTVIFDRGVTFHEACQKCPNWYGVNGFYKQNGLGDSIVLAINTNGESWQNEYHVQMKLFRPHLGLKLGTISLAELRQSHYKLSPEEAEYFWSNQYTRCEHSCVHLRKYNYCINGPTCNNGTRKRRFTVIAGSLFSKWQLIENAKQNNECNNQRMQVFRLTTDLGQKIVGILIPQKCVNDIIKSLELDSTQFIE